MKKPDKRFIVKAILTVLAVIMSIVGLYYFKGEYVWWGNIPMVITLSALFISGSALFAGVFAARKGNKKSAAVSAVTAALVAGFIIWGITYIINIVIGKGQMNVIAADAATAAGWLYFGILAGLCLSSFFKKKAVKILLPVLSIGVCAVIAYSFVDTAMLGLIYNNYKAASPVLGESETERGSTMTDFDFYVSTGGSDENDGTREAPFLTIEKAIEAVRNTEKAGKDGISVCIKEGEYRVSSIVFTKEDSGKKECPVTYYADGEVILNGGVTLSPSDFVSAEEYPEIADRLSREAKESVRVIDLKKEPYSLRAEDWGKIFAIGSYNTATQYDGDYTGPLYCELFVNDKRQTIARYPDEGFLYTEEVVKTGLGKESDGAATAVENWYDIRNPEPDVYRVNEELAGRIGSWKTLDDVWMMGYWKYDWADASTLIGNFEEETGILSPKFVSLYGTKTDAPYYFFNVLEELTAEGEWYLDRENGLLCLWTTEDFADAEIDLSLSLDAIIEADADYLTFDGFTVKGTRGDAVRITGDGNTVQNCLIKNVAGNALYMKGCSNLAYSNEITRTGKGGIYIDGGDRETLTPGNSRADNNFIHDWSEIYLTYQPAVTLSGVGNVCSHNEMANSPHEAITWSGNNHIIEYNNIHDVCLLSDDAGAIYSGRRWDWYGTVIRYNAIYNIGADGHSPDGIYLDDALSGIEVYGNILINIPKWAIHLGGGRDLEVWGNIIINAGERAVSYDSRARDGALENGWFNHAVKDTGDMWQNLYSSPWKSEVWQEAFPQYKNYTDDFSRSEEAGFVPNPGNSNVRDNLIFDKAASIGNISEAADRFSSISREGIFSLGRLDSFFTDAENGDYSIKDIDALKEILPGFEEFSLDEIGRK
ncbi:MAG: right-handed parallel beta-helix repeat-containing protein [Clostridia bacterium]|nr:right-handed parallel beta-helix repeat-containing protein [Clostridia bacterium]